MNFFISLFIKKNPKFIRSSIVWKKIKREKKSSKIVTRNKRVEKTLETEILTIFSLLLLRIRKDKIFQIKQANKIERNFSWRKIHLENSICAVFLSLHFKCFLNNIYFAVWLFKIFINERNGVEKQLKGVGFVVFSFQFYFIKILSRDFHIWFKHPWDRNPRYNKRWVNSSKNPIKLSFYFRKIHENSSPIKGS
jgi:hypothetical protein